MARFEKFLKETKILAFPLYRQTFGWNCGTTAAHMIMSFYDKDMHENKIMKIAGGSKEIGVPIEGLKKVFSKYGLSFDESSNLSTDDLRKNIDKGCPTLIMIQAWTREDNPDWKNEWDQGHYTVCIGYDENKIVFADPANIKKVWLTDGSLNSRWHGWSDDGKKIGHWGLLFTKTSKFSYEEMEEMG